MSEPGHSTPTIHIVDDDAAMRDSLRFLLEQEGWDIRSYATGAALLALDLPPFGCVLTDFQMPGMNGLQLQAELAARRNALPVIVMTGHGDITMAVRAMKAGAVDFLEKPFAGDQLTSVIRRALATSARTVATNAIRLDAHSRVALLTPREREVLRLLVAGSSSKEIALVLGTSPRTIDVHRARVFQKLRADSLPQLVQIAITAEEISPP